MCAFWGTPRAKHVSFFFESEVRPSLTARPQRGRCLLVGSGYDACTIGAPKRHGSCWKRAKFHLRRQRVYEQRLTQSTRPRLEWPELEEASGCWALDARHLPPTKRVMQTSGSQQHSELRLATHATWSLDSAGFCLGLRDRDPSAHTALRRQRKTLQGYDAAKHCQAPAVHEHLLRPEVLKYAGSLPAAPGLAVFTSRPPRTSAMISDVPAMKEQNSALPRPTAATPQSEAPAPLPS